MISTLKKAWLSFKVNNPHWAFGIAGIAIGFTILLVSGGFLSNLTNFIFPRADIRIPNSIVSQIEKGDDAFFREDYEKALSHYDEAVADLEYLKNKRPGLNGVEMMLSPVYSRKNIAASAITLSEISERFDRRAEESG